MELTDEQFSDVLVGAVRYALGRQTYYVSSITELGISSVRHITVGILDVIIRDIKEMLDGNRPPVVHRLAVLATVPTSTRRRKAEAMISLDLLKQVQTIVVHKDCADGMASAILLHDVLPKAGLEFVQYNTPERENLVVRPNMLFCDFTPPPDRNQEFIDAGAIVLDHHKGCQAQVEAFGVRGIFADEKKEPGVSGAVLAYWHVWEPIKEKNDAHVTEAARALEFAGIAGIYDTWRRDSSLWQKAKEQQEALRFYPADSLLCLTEPFWTNWDVFSQMMEVGEILTVKKAKDVKAALKGAWRGTSLKGTRLVAFNDTKVISEAADAAEEADLIFGFRYEADKLICSIRSRGNYNCFELAQRYGGNGHTAAAGFSVPLIDAENDDEPVLHPFHHIKVLVDVHEASRG